MGYGNDTQGICNWFVKVFIGGFCGAVLAFEKGCAPKIYFRQKAEKVSGADKGTWKDWNGK
jgi:hypothetical protein